MLSLLLYLYCVLHIVSALATSKHSALTYQDDRIVSQEVFDSLEELARVVDITYCVGSTGVWKPFKCLSRCNEFPSFELVTSWNTGILLSDSCGYIALDHGAYKKRIIVAFRGTYSIANTIADLSTGHAEYTPYPADGNPDYVCPSEQEQIQSQPTKHQAPNPAPLLRPQFQHDTHSTPSKLACQNCTVHSGFALSWLNTRCVILPHIEKALSLYPDYELTLVGHSLGGAVAALAALEFESRGWNPHVTTFGEPRLGNYNLNRFIDQTFNLVTSTAPGNGTGTGTGNNGTGERDLEKQRYRRVTHTSDPVPLLPLAEWGYSMHAGEIFISKVALSPMKENVRYCIGDADTSCINGGAATTARDRAVKVARDVSKIREVEVDGKDGIGPFDVMTDDRMEVQGEKSGEVEKTDRLALWQLFFAHRDYFWRLGLCVPGGDPWNWRRPGYGHDDGDDYEL